MGYYSFQIEDSNMSNASISLTRARKALAHLSDEMDDSNYITNKLVGFHLNESQACEVFNDLQQDGSIAISQHLQIIRAVYTLRSLIAKANSSYGIESLMNEQRRLMKEDSVFQNIVSRGSKTVLTMEEFKSKFNYESTILNTRFGNTSSGSGIGCSSISQSCIDCCAQEIKSIKKQLRDIEDKLSQLNNSTNIVVEGTLHQILLDHDLI
jgi:hypothetical protein